jgi:ABC-type polysaccharide/polyol phosphate export permease
MINVFKEILQYKELLINLTAKELKLKYKNSALGFLWSFLNPLLMLLVYTFAFKYVLKIKIDNFPIFLLAGLLPWTFFQASVQGSTNSIVANSNLIKKVHFPREIIPISIIASNLINFVIMFLVLIVALFSFEIRIGMTILFLPLVFALLAVFTIGIALALSSLNVLYRDVSHLIEVVFMIWFYITPIVYSIDLIPQNYRNLLLINPMSLVIESFRSIILHNNLPNATYLLGLFIYDIIVLFIGTAIFRSIEKSFAEEI